jgi:hypothetical protein
MHFSDCGMWLFQDSQSPRTPFLGRYTTNDNLVHSAGCRVYKDAHPGRQEVSGVASETMIAIDMHGGSYEQA